MSRNCAYLFQLDSIKEVVLPRGEFFVEAAWSRIRGWRGSKNSASQSLENYCANSLVDDV